MNKFVKLPLFLGVTCLVAGGLLAGVVALTDPVIESARLERLSKAFRVMYDDESALSTAQAELSKEFINENQILSINKVKHSGLTSYVYQCKSKSAYEEMQFYVGIDYSEKAVDSFYMLETSEHSLGYGNFSDNDSVTELYSGYQGKEDKIIANTTVTSKAVKAAVDRAYADFQTRSATWGE